MPAWLQFIAHGNPLTYQIDALRSMMLAGQTCADGMGLDLAVLLIATTMLVLICARLCYLCLLC